jgi:hypothetical protein
LATDPEHGKRFLRLLVGEDVIFGLGADLRANLPLFGQPLLFLFYLLVLARGALAELSYASA